MIHCPCLKNKPLFFIAIVSSLALNGCALHPANAPAPNVPPAWQQQAVNAHPENTLSSRWWDYFNDPALDQLIDKAVSQNLDYKLAIARIDEARALYRNARAQLLPEVQAVASAERTHVPTNGNSFRTGNVDQFSLGFDAGWEIDLFGRNRNIARAAKADTNAAVAESRAVTLSLLAEVARQYTLYRLYREQADLAESNSQAQQAILKISEARYKQGVEGNLELMRSRALLDTTKGQIPLYQNLAQASAYQIDYLTGEKPGASGSLLEGKTDIPLINRDIFMDIPLNIIRQRPDIAAAEQRVIAANAMTQAAVAELYPSVSISALLGLSAATPGSLLQSDSKNWSLGGSILAPLFDFGRIRANIDASKSRETQAVLTYEQTVLAALRDIETAASAYQKARERFVTLDRAEQSSRQAAIIAGKQYKEGILSQLDVLQAEQTSYNAQESAAQAAADLTQNFIALCKTLALLPSASFSQ